MSKTITWTDPTTNTDGSPIVAGQITSYIVGIRTLSGTVGEYPTEFVASSLARANEIIAAIADVLAPGTYIAAVQAVGAAPSSWSAESTFIVAPPVVLVPNPPTGLTVT